MSCQKPREVYRPAIGGPLQFSKPIKGDAGVDYHRLNIPCGECIECQSEKARQWAIRIAHEAQLWEENSFVTLSYADEHLPEHNSLKYEDLEAFWDRFRSWARRQGKIRPRYYSVGEYGDKSLRPHYHACIFGYAFTEERIMLRGGTKPLWTNTFLQNMWGKGHVSVGMLNFATARYTASYVTKKLKSKQKYVRVDEDTGELIPLEQPRALMSRNIAKEWWDKYRHQVSANDQVVINGDAQKPPKVYDRWLSARSEVAGEMIKEERMKKAQTLTQEQRDARARVTHAHARNKNKTL